MNNITRSLIVGLIGAVLLVFGIFRVVNGGHDVGNLGYGSIVAGALFLIAAVVLAVRGRSSNR